MIHVLGFALLIYGLFYGSYANPLWKLYKDSNNYANGLFRALIGAPAWAAAILLLMGNLGGFFGCLVLTAGCAALPLYKMYKDGILNVKNAHLLIMASMGSWGRVLLAWTIIGLVVTKHTKRAAEIGWQGAAEEWMYRDRSNDPAPVKAPTMDYIPTTEEAPAPKKEVEVWLEQENGSMKRAVVNSDGTMYRDPDTHDWLPIKK